MNIVNSLFDVLFPKLVLETNLSGHISLYEDDELDGYGATSDSDDDDEASDFGSSLEDNDDWSKDED